MSQEQPNTNYSEMFRQNTSDANSIQVKRDTKELKKNIYIYLKGIGEVYEQNDDGELIVSFKEVGEPKVNDKGLQTIMMMIESLVNSNTVAGNLSENAYNDIISDFHYSLYNDLFENSKNYELDTKNYNSVVVSITNLVRVFITRPINDKERIHDSNIQSKDTFINNGGVQQPKRKYSMW